MAKTYSKKDIFDGKLFDEAINEANQMIKVLEVMDTKIIQLSSTYKTTLNSATTNNKKGIEDIIKVSNELNVVTEQANKIEKDKLEAYNKLTETEKRKLASSERLLALEKKREEQTLKTINQARKLAEAEEKAHAKREQQYNKEIQQAEKIAQKEAEKTAKLERNYNKVQSALNAVSQKYQDLAIKKEMGDKLSAKEEMRLNRLQALTLKYDQALRKVDGGMNKWTRNVGNYSNAYNGLGMSVSQLSREMPAFANSVQTGFMAISNNLPMFFDEITKIKNANKELAASGEPTKSVFKQLGGAIFSTSTLLSIGVTLLTVYGAKVIEMLSGSKNTEEQLKREAKAREEINRKKREAAEFVGKESAQLVGNLMALKATIAGSKERIEMIKKINDQYGTHLKNLQNERDFQLQVNNAIHQYIQFQREAFRVKRNLDLIELNLAKQDMAYKSLRSSIGLTTKEMDRISDKAGGFGILANALSNSIAPASELVSQLGFTEKRANQVVSAYQKLQKQSEVNAKTNIEQQEVNSGFLNSLGEIVGLTDEYTNLKEGQHKDAIKTMFFLDQENKMLVTYGVNIKDAQSKMGDWSKSTKDQTENQKELNTQLERTDIYLSRFIELQDDITDKLENRGGSLIQKQLDAEFEAQKENADLGWAYSILKIDELIDLKEKLMTEHEKRLTEIQIRALKERADEETKAELEALEKRYKELINQENITEEAKAQIRAQYDADRITIDNNDIKRKEDVNKQAEALEIDLQDNITVIEEEAQKDRIQKRIELNDLSLKHDEETKRREEENKKKAEEEENKRFEEEKKRAKERQKLRQDIVNQTIEEMKQLSDERQKYLDDTISKEQKLQEALQAQANAGNITAQESIAASIEAQKKATLAKQQEQAKQKRLEEMKILYNLIETKIAANKDLPKEEQKSTIKIVSEALAETGLVRGAAKLLDNIKGFYKGTQGKLKDENQAIKSGKDGHLIWADGDEMIVNPTQTNKLASVGLDKTDDVVNSAIMYKMNVGLLGFNAKNPQASQSQTDMYLKKLVDVMESKGEFYLDPIVVNGIAKGVVSTEIKGNVTKYSEYRPKG